MGGLKELKYTSSNITLQLLQCDTQYETKLQSNKSNKYSDLQCFVCIMGRKGLINDNVCVQGEVITYNGFIYYLHTQGNIERNHFKTVFIRLLNHLSALV